MALTEKQQRRLDLFEARERIMAIEGLSIAQQRQRLDALYAVVDGGGQARDFDGRGVGEALGTTEYRHTITVYLN